MRFVAALLALIACNQTGQEHERVRPRRAEARAAAPRAGAVPDAPALPPAPEAWTELVRLEHAPFAVPRAPTAAVHAPRGFRASAPLELVIFLHGWSGCAAVLTQSGAVPCREGERPRAGWGLASTHDEAGTNSLFIVLQLAYLERDGDPGRLREPGMFRAMLAELLGERGPLGARLGGARPLGDVRSITLIAHSAGYESALAILEQGGVGDLVRHVVLMDALYAGDDVFGAWVAAAPAHRRKLVSIHTDQRTTSRLSSALGARALGSLGAARVVVDPPLDALADAIRAHDVVIARTDVAHGSVPIAHMADVLRGLSLSTR